MKKPFLFPAVQNIVMHRGSFPMGPVCRVQVPREDRELFRIACEVFPTKVMESMEDISETLQGQQDSMGVVEMIRQKQLPAQGYRITVKQSGIELASSDKAGTFYGLQTLAQLCAAYDAHIPCMEITDAPGLALRGVLVDISRGKVPTLNTLKQIADYMARCKLNHLQLYVEGASYAYPSRREVWQEETPITPEELRLLDAYCRERFIELVPCQNTLGHMARWLAMPSYNSFAECSEGFTVMGMHFPPTTLDAGDGRSLDFVTGLLEELLPCFTSEYCNVCMDEPFEFGMGKNKDLKDGKYALYAAYAAKLHDFLKRRQKKMMMWGDVISRDASVLEQLPDEVVILEWGYEAEYPIAQRAAILAESGHGFCLCPGTNSWLSFTGLTDNMLTAIGKAGEAAHRYRALGIMVTDWGDMGHLQYLPVSWAGILAGAAWGWSEKGCTEEILAHALDTLVFQDASGKMGQLVLDSGRYVELEEFKLPCRTLAASVLSTGLLTQEAYEQALERTAKSITFFSPESVCRAYLESYARKKELNAQGIYQLLEEMQKELEDINLQCRDGQLVLREYRNALRQAAVLTRLREFIYHGFCEAEASGIIKELRVIMEEHRYLWSCRNKSHGCQEGLAPFQRIMEQMGAALSEKQRM